MYQTFEAPPTLECGGNAYSDLTSEQQSDIYEELLKLCHPIEILQRDNFILNIGTLPTSLAKKPGLGIVDFVTTPKADHAIERRKIVAIDCEWVTAEDRRKEPVWVCAIDGLTGETLINALIAPLRPIKQWRTHVHGIAENSIAEVTIGELDCLQGWKEARAKLFDYIDDQTILMGHGIRNDLELLRLFHTTIVDSQILATDAVFKKSKKKIGYKWPIDKVCESFLGISIRQDATSETQSHDTLENVLASREIVLQCIQRPKDLQKWAKEERVEFWKPINEKSAIKEAKKAAKSPIDQNKHPVNSLTMARIEDWISEQLPQRQASRVASTPEPIAQMLDRSEHPAGYQAGYEAGYQAAYQAAFQAGFRIGYERGCQQANAGANQPWTRDQDQDECQSNCQGNIQETNREIDEKQILDGQNSDMNRNEKGASSLLTGLLNDIRAENVANGAKLAENRQSKAPERPAYEKDEREMILQLCRIAISAAKSKPQLSAAEQAARREEKKARKQAKREAKTKKKEEAKAKKAKEETEKTAVMMKTPLVETQTTPGQALGAVEVAVQEEASDGGASELEEFDVFGVEAEINKY